MKKQQLRQNTSSPDSRVFYDLRSMRHTPCTDALRPWLIGVSVEVAMLFEEADRLPAGYRQPRSKGDAAYNNAHVRVGCYAPPNPEDRYA